jgi:hypothetical protein
MYLGPYLVMIALLLFWGGLGWTVLKLLQVRCDSARLLLLSPLTGICVVLVLVLWLNVAGLPIESFTRPLTACLALVAGFGIIRWSPVHTLGRTGVILAIVISSLIVCGLPSVLYGFDWIANSNDDWANYNLGALRFLKGGYFAAPHPEAMTQGLDYPAYYWFFYVAYGTRAGCELLLAWLAGLLGWNPFFVFMPVILAFQGVLLLSATALAARFLTKRYVLNAGLALTAFSPFSFYAVQQQLIAQVVGLAVLAGLSTIALVPLSRISHFGTAIFCGLLAAGSLLIYPEIVGFFGLSFLLYHGFRFIRSRSSVTGRRILGLLAVAATAFALTGPFAVNAFLFLLFQVKYSQTQGAEQGVSIFPWFVIPSGLGTWWGFIQFGDIPGEPWSSIWIVLGSALAVVTVFMVIRGVRRAEPSAFVGVPMLLVGLLLIRSANQFGLFKLAMFSGMIIWFFASGFLAMIIASRRIYTACIGALLLCMVPAVRAGIVQSTEIEGGSDIPNGSQAHLLSQALALKDNRPEFCNADFESSLRPLVKILAAQPDCQRLFLGRDVFSILPELSGRPTIFVKDDSEVLSLGKELVRRHTELRFPTDAAGSIKASIAPPPPTANFFGRVSDKFSIFNLDQTNRIEIGAPSAFPNRLVFVSSDLGSHYYIPESPDIAYYLSERDPFFAGQPIAALGRYLVFRVNDPSPRVRLSLWLTASPLVDRDNALPPAAISGRDYVPLGLSGRGSARVVSEPLTPLTVGDAHYLLLDLGTEARIPRVPRNGLMALYGANVPIDTRRIAAYARRIRLIDDATFDAADTIDGIRALPADLADPRLQYQGIYEDGWVGSRVRVRLASRGSGDQKIVVRGSVPGGVGLDDQNVVLRVNGQVLAEKKLTPGDFDVTAPVGAGVDDVTLEFAVERHLPFGDHRPVSAHLQSVVIQ